MTHQTQDYVTKGDQGTIDLNDTRDSVGLIAEALSETEQLPPTTEDQGAARTPCVHGDEGGGHLTLAAAAPSGDTTLEGPADGSGVGAKAGM